MNFNKKELLAELTQKTKQNIENAERLLALPKAALTFREAPDKWNVLECIQHLNWYSDYYNPEIERRIKAAPRREAPTFKTNWLGKKFVKAVSPVSQGSKTMNTLKSKNPMNMEFNSPILDQFIKDQHKMLELLEAAHQVDLTKVKTGITFSNWIRIRLGDTFRVVIYHNQRHLEQAERAANASGLTAGAPKLTA